MEKYKYIKDLSPKTQQAIFERISKEYQEYQDYHNYLDTELDDEHIGDNSRITNISCHIYHRYKDENGRWEREKEATIFIPRKQIIFYEQKGKWG